MGQLRLVHARFLQRGGRRVRPAGLPVSRFPGVPLKTFTTDVQYCEQFSRYGAQINKLIDGIDPGFKPRKHAIGACTL